MPHPDIKPVGGSGRRPKQKRSSPGVRKRVVKPFSPKRANRYFILFIFIASCLLYGNTILNDLSVGDQYFTRDAVVKQGMKAIPLIFSSRSSWDSGQTGVPGSVYEPVTKLTFALEYEFFGDRPGMSHAFNLVIYFFLSALLFFLLKRILNRYNILFPFLITMLFMVHPVHTEVVASLKNRGEMLAFLCGCGALWYLTDYAETRSFRFLFFALLLFFTGALCKGSIFFFILIFPFILHFHSGMPLRKSAPAFLLSLAVVVSATFLPRIIIPGMTVAGTWADNPLFIDHNFWIRIGTSFMALLFYLKILVYPVHLVYYYGYDMIQIVSMLNLWVLFSMLLHAILLFYAIRKFREKHILSLAILWYLLAIVPFSNLFFPVRGIVSESFVFTASAGFCIAVVYVIFTLFRTDPRTLTIETDARIEILSLLIIITIPSTLMTISRNTNWKNQETLYKADMDELAYSANANLGYAGFLLQKAYASPEYRKRGRVDENCKHEIISRLRRSLRIYPKNINALNEIAKVYLEVAGQPDSSLIFLGKATELDPLNEEALLNLGKTYLYLGDYRKAAYYARMAEAVKK
ncbi:MAG: tetratricopeptide repeat protein [bacterium]